MRQDACAGQHAGQVVFVWAPRAVVFYHDQASRHCGALFAVCVGVVLCMVFLQWHTMLLMRCRWRKLPDGRQMKYLRIDGSTTLEDRESAIQQFNNPEGGVCALLHQLNDTLPCKPALQTHRFLFFSCRFVQQGVV